jgi:hypothetical protein
MRGDKSLSLPCRFELSHSSLSHSGCLMRLLSPIIRAPVAVMDNIWHQLTMCNRIAPQFISNDLPGLSAMRLEQAPEEPLGRSAIPSGLEKYINYFAILVNSPPQIMLLAVDLDEDLIDKERITIAPVFSFPIYWRTQLRTFHKRIASRLTVMPGSASRSSISRWLRLNR